MKKSFITPGPGVREPTYMLDDLLGLSGMKTLVSIS